MSTLYETMNSLYETESVRATGNTAPFDPLNLTDDMVIRLGRCGEKKALAVVKIMGVLMLQRDSILGLPTVMLEVKDHESRLSLAGACLVGYARRSGEGLFMIGKLGLPMPDAIALNRAALERFGYKKTETAA